MVHTDNVVAQKGGLLWGLGCLRLFVCGVGKLFIELVIHVVKKMSSAEDSLPQKLNLKIKKKW